MTSKAVGPGAQPLSDAETVRLHTPSPGVHTLGPYSFPHSKLKRRVAQEDKTPLVLVACGSFSRKPPSFSSRLLSARFD